MDQATTKLDHLSKGCHNQRKQDNRINKPNCSNKFNHHLNWVVNTQQGVIGPRPSKVLSSCKAALVFPGSYQERSSKLASIQFRISTDHQLRRELHRRCIRSLVKFFVQTDYQLRIVLSKEDITRTVWFHRQTNHQFRRKPHTKCTVVISLAESNIERALEAQLRFAITLIVSLIESQRGSALGWELQ